MTIKCPICKQPMLKFARVLAIHLMDKHKYTKKEADKRAGEAMKNEEG